MCIRDRANKYLANSSGFVCAVVSNYLLNRIWTFESHDPAAVSYTHLRAHETVLDLVCRLLLEKKNIKTKYTALSIYVHNYKFSIMSGVSYTST